MDGPCRSLSLSLDLQGQAPPCLLPPVRWAPGLASKAWLVVLRACLPRGPGLRLTDGYAAPPCPRLPVWGRRSPCFLGGPGGSARLRSPGPHTLGSGRAGEGCGDPSEEEALCVLPWALPGGPGPLPRSLGATVSDGRWREVLSAGPAVPGRVGAPQVTLSASPSSRTCWGPGFPS